MLHALPNPRKSFHVNHNLEYTNNALNHLVLFTEKYKLFESTPTLNKCVYEASEFLSLGVYIDISVSFVTEGLSQITIEVRRKIGTFNQAHEIGNANIHISNLEKVISSCLSEDEISRNQKFKEINDSIQIKKDEHQRKLDENIARDKSEKENEPILYYGKQILYVLATIGLIGGFIYFVMKVI